MAGAIDATPGTNGARWPACAAGEPRRLHRVRLAPSYSCPPKRRAHRLIDLDLVGLEGFGGIAFEQMYYGDNQTLPNRVKAEFGPAPIVGLELRF